MTSTEPITQQSTPNEAELFFQQETSPYEPEQIETGRGPLPAFIRCLPETDARCAVQYADYFRLQPFG
jgi:hypothetical protein